jgi:hypothetical protein
MPPTFDASRFKNQEEPSTQYLRQLERLAAEGKQVDCIQQAVDGAMANLITKGRASFVIYGEPQSGKTEMMICLTARPERPGLRRLPASVTALTRELARLEDQRGQPFPARNGPLRTGRPIRYTCRVQVGGAPLLTPA